MQIFTATDFLAAALEHIPPKHQQTVRYYGLYSNKHRGMDRIHQFGPDSNGSAHPPPPTTVPPPPASSARALRPLWRDLIFRVWGEDPLLCPCCKSLMIVAGTLLRPEEIEFLRLHGLWEPIIDMPPPPEPPYDVETMEPIRSASVSGYRGVARERNGAQTADEWQAPERALDEEPILVLDAEQAPGYE